VKTGGVGGSRERKEAANYQHNMVEFVDIWRIISAHVD
jgi:hypothetical protein